MKQTLRLTMFAALACATAAAQAQFFHRFDGGSISVGGTGQFSTILTSNPNNSSESVMVHPFPSQTITESVPVSGQVQNTTWSTGFVTKLQFHPLPFAGIELNYGFTRYSERYTFNTASAPFVTAGTSQVTVPTYWHEATAAYMIHPKHIPFQPYLGIGGGAIDFDSHDNQWRGTGLLETGFDLPVKYNRIGFRVGARTLVYRSPNFNSLLFSTRSWRATSEPEISTYYRF